MYENNLFTIIRLALKLARHVYNVFVPAEKKLNLTVELFIM